MGIRLREIILLSLFLFFVNAAVGNPKSIIKDVSEKPRNFGGVDAEKSKPGSLLRLKQSLDAKGKAADALKTFDDKPDRKILEKEDGCPNEEFKRYGNMCYLRIQTNKQWKKPKAQKVCHKNGAKLASIKSNLVICRIKVKDTRRALKGDDTNADTTGDNDRRALKGDDTNADTTGDNDRRALSATRCPHGFKSTYPQTFCIKSVRTRSKWSENRAKMLCKVGHPEAFLYRSTHPWGFWCRFDITKGRRALGNNIEFASADNEENDRRELKLNPCPSGFKPNKNGKFCLFKLKVTFLWNRRRAIAYCKSKGAKLFRLSDKELVCRSKLSRRELAIDVEFSSADNEENNRRELANPNDEQFLEENRASSQSEEQEEKPVLKVKCPSGFLLTRDEKFCILTHRTTFQWDARHAKEFCRRRRSRLSKISSRGIICQRPALKNRRSRRALAMKKAMCPPGFENGLRKNFCIHKRKTETKWDPKRAQKYCKELYPGSKLFRAHPKGVICRLHMKQPDLPIRDMAQVTVENLSLEESEKDNEDYLEEIENLSVEEYLETLEGLDPEIEEGDFDEFEGGDFDELDFESEIDELDFESELDELDFESKFDELDFESEIDEIDFESEIDEFDFESKFDELDFESKFDELDFESELDELDFESEFVEQDLELKFDEIDFESELEELDFESEIEELDFESEFVEQDLELKEDGCMKGWIQIEGDCFLYVKEELNFDDAEDYCEELNPEAHLATIKSSFQNEVVASLAEKHSENFIGLVYNADLDDLVWASGEEVTYTSEWHEKPGSGSESTLCTRLVGADHKWKPGLWDDWDCENASRFFCSYSLENEAEYDLEDEYELEDEEYALYDEEYVLDDEDIIKNEEDEEEEDSYVLDEESCVTVRVTVSGDSELTQYSGDYVQLPIYDEFSEKPTRMNDVGMFLFYDGETWGISPPQFSSMGTLIEVGTGYFYDDTMPRNGLFSAELEKGEHRYGEVDVEFVCLDDEVEIECDESVANAQLQNGVSSGILPPWLNSCDAILDIFGFEMCELPMRFLGDMLGFDFLGDRISFDLISTKCPIACGVCELDECSPVETPYNGVYHQTDEIIQDMPVYVEDSTGYRLFLDGQFWFFEDPSQEIGIMAETSSGNTEIPTDNTDWVYLDRKTSESHSYVPIRCVPGSDCQTLTVGTCDI